MGLAGGGTDISPYCDIHGGYVLNATINRYAYTVIKILTEPVVCFRAADLEQEKKYNLDEHFNFDGKLDLHKAVYREIIDNYNNGKKLPVEVITHCDAPAGSGLGSSSTVVVSMVKAFTELLNLPLDDYEQAYLAFKIERDICQLKGGRQDQYSATFGGFNFMEFYAENRAIINPLRIKNWILCELEASLLLFYTGVSRESANIIEDQSGSLIRSESRTLEAMHRMKEDSLRMKESLLKGDFLGMVKVLAEGWENKKSSSRFVSNAYLNDIHAAAMNAGAQAGKASGAGGGGFMVFFVDSARRMNVIRALENFEGRVSNCHFTHNGAQAWKL